MAQAKRPLSSSHGVGHLLATAAFGVPTLPNLFHVDVEDLRSGGYDPLAFVAAVKECFSQPLGLYFFPR